MKKYYLRLVGKDGNHRMVFCVANDIVEAKKIFVNKFKIIKHTPYVIFSFKPKNTKHTRFYSLDEIRKSGSLKAHDKINENIVEVVY